MADDYDVGYGRPPRHSQFKAGRSGNPHGRPKGTPNLKTAIAKVMKSKVAVRKGNQTLLMSPTDAIAHKLLQKSLEGDPKALKTLIEVGGLNDALADAVQKATPFAPEDLEILQEALARKSGELEHCPSEETKR